MPKLIEIEGATNESGFKILEDHLKECLNELCDSSSSSSSTDRVHTFKIVPRENENAQLLALVELDADLETLTKYPVFLQGDGKLQKITSKPCNNPLYLEHLISLREKEQRNILPKVKEETPQKTTSLDQMPQPHLSSPEKIGACYERQASPGSCLPRATNVTVSKCHASAKKQDDSDDGSSSSSELEYQECSEMFSEIDKFKVLVENINPRTSEDCLFNFLEGRSDTTPVERILGDVPGVALVTFEKEPDIEALKEGSKMRFVEGHQLRISTVEKPCSVIVSGLPVSASTDSIKLALENHRRGVGGEVKSVRKVGSHRKALVVFAKSSDAERSCDPSLKVKVEDTLISMKLYYPCLYSSNTIESDEVSSLPDARENDVVTQRFEIGVEKYLTNFLYKSEMYHKKLQKELMEINCTLIWEKTQILVEYKASCINPTLTKSAEKIIFDFILENKLITDKVQVEPSLHKSIHMKLSKRLQDMNQMVSVYKEESNLIAAGQRDSVKTIVSQIQEIYECMTSKSSLNMDTKSQSMASESQNMATESQNMDTKSPRMDTKSQNMASESESMESESMKIKSESMNIKGHHMKFMVVSKFENSLQKDFPNLNIILNTRENTVEFKGTQSDIFAAKLKIQMYISDILGEDVSIDNDMTWIILEQPKTQNFLEETLAKSGVVCCVDIQEHTHVVRLCALSEEDIAKGQDLMKKCIEEKIFQIVDESKDCLNCSEWSDLKLSLKEMYAGKIVIDVSEDNKVTVITTEDIAQDVQSKINKYFKTRAIQQKNVYLTKPVCRYFHEYKQADIVSITMRLRSENVKITDNEHGLFVSGTVAGVDKALDELNKMKSDVISKEVKIKYPGIKELLSKESGKDLILIVEKKQKCVIIPETESSKYTEETGAAIGLGKRWTFSGNRTVQVHHGDITKLRVDAIVNAANESLDHFGGIALEIVQKGGDRIQEDCKTYIAKYGPMSDGDVYSSIPGNLPAKVIIHAVGPHWQGGNKSEDEILAKTVQNILKEANKCQFTSVAIPALSSGIFGYPLELAVNVIVNALKDYWFNKGSKGTVTDVTFCDISKKTIRTFVDVLDKTFGDGGASSTESKFKKKSSTVSNSDDEGSDGDSDSDNSSSSSRGSNPSELIQLVKGNLADQKVEVLVTPVSRDLDFSASAVSNSLLQKGGERLQRNCRKKYEDGLDSEEIGVIDGGHLASKKIFFGCLKKMDRSGIGEKVLSKFVTSCLKKAEEKSFTSVAFPALGTGKLGFPADISASLMHDAVMSHFKYNPSSSVQKVLFVIHLRDTAVLKAFQNTLKEGEHSIQTPHKGYSHGYNQKSSPDHYHKHSTGQSSFHCGGINVEVLQGDITKESTDCIVNSTNSNLDLKIGAVSKALLTKAGPDLEEECDDKREYMKKNGVALTSAGNLSCQYILHVKAQDSDYGWSKILTKGLSLVDQNGITSLSIPALGTGGRKVSAETVASVIAETIKKFGYSHKSSSLKNIRLIIYQGSMMSAFKSAFTRERGDHSHKMREKQDVRDVKPKHSLNESFLITIYGEGEDVVNAAKKDFIDQCKRKFEKKTLSDGLVGKISDFNKDQISLIQNIANEFNVELSTSSEGQLEVFGLAENVSKAYDKILEKILSMKQFEQRRTEAKVLSSLVQWYYIDQHGESKPFSRGNNAQLEKAHRDKERYIEIKDPRGRSFKVDLKKMEEYPTTGSHIKINIVRNDNKGAGHSQMVAGEKEAMSGKKTAYFTLHAERTHKDTAEEHHYRTAESQFLRLLGSGAAQYRVLKVEYVVNPELTRKFRAAQANLKKTRGEKNSDPILAFHGTNVENIKKICEGGFLAPGDSGFKVKTDSGYYGAGVYFSEYPKYSMGYISGSTTIMLCQVLQGKPYTCPQLMHGSSLQSGYDSHVSPDGKELIIFNTSCILPSYIVHYGANSADFKYQ